MNTKEAIQAMLNGKKVYRKAWGSGYFYFDGACFRTEDEELIMADFSGNGWEIYEEPKKQTVTIEKLLVKTAFNVGFKVVEASADFIKSHYAEEDRVKLLDTYEVEI